MQVTPNSFAKAVEMVLYFWVNSARRLREYLVTFPDPKTSLKAVVAITRSIEAYHYFQRPKHDICQHHRRAKVEFGR